LGATRQLRCFADDDEFKRALVFLRRAFGRFQPRRKNAALPKTSAKSGAQTPTLSAKVLSTELTEKEKEKLDELSGFDFENL